MTERINYSIDEGDYCGHCVNMPIVIQARTLEDLKIQTKEVMQSYIYVLQKMLDNDDLEFIELNRISKPSEL